jgi:hypothetical protein
MFKHLSERLQDLGWRFHGFVLGMSLAGGTMLAAGQGCAATGG